MLDREVSFVRKIFVRAYKKGGKLYWEGHVRDLAKVSKVAIYATSSPIVDLMNADDAKSVKEMDEFNASSDHFTWIGFPNTQPLDSAMEHGKDVTMDFITQPPGQSSPISQILSNTWVTSIGGGVILLLIGAYFGLG